MSWRPCSQQLWPVSVTHTRFQCLHAGWCTETLAFNHRVKTGGPHYTWVYTPTPQHCKGYALSPRSHQDMMLPFIGCRNLRSHPGRRGLITLYHLSSFQCTSSTLDRPTLGAARRPGVASAALKGRVKVVYGFLKNLPLTTLSCIQF